MSIKQKLTTGFLLLIILPSICLQIWSYRVVSDIMLERISEAELQAVNSGLKETQNIFSEMGRILVWLVADIDVRTLLQAENDAVGQADNAFQYAQMLQSEKILEHSRLILMKYPFDIMLLPDNGTPHGNCENMFVYADKIRASAWYKELMTSSKGAIFWGDTVDRKQPHDSFSFFAAIPIKGIENPQKAIGIAFVGISEKYVYHTLRSVNPRGEVCLINNREQIVSAKDKTQILQPSSILTDEGVSLTENHSWRKVRQNGEEMIAVRSDHITRNWSALSFTSYQQISGRLYSMQNRWLLLYILVTGVFVLVALIIAGLISKPIIQLSHTMEQVEKGDLQVRATVTSKREIGVLERNFNRMLDRIAQLMDDVKQREQQKRDAEIDALQAQINPHFLFNVLSSIRWASHDETAEQMVIGLSALLKTSMKKGGNLITMKEECEMLKQYVQLNNLRRHGQVKLMLDVSQEVRKLKLPRFILQPLIENAIIHGFEVSNSAGTIELSAAMDEFFFTIHVKDSGQGFPPDFQLGEQEVPEHRNSGSYSSIGLCNVRERLMLYYGDGASLHWENRTDSAGAVTGACVVVRIPIDAMKNMETEKNEKENEKT